MSVTVLGPRLGHGLAIRLAGITQVRLWTRSPAHAAAMAAARVNARYLPGQALPANCSRRRPGRRPERRRLADPPSPQRLPAPAANPARAGRPDSPDLLCKGSRRHARLPHEVLEETWPQHRRPPCCPARASPGIARGLLPRSPSPLAMRIRAPRRPGAARSTPAPLCQQRCVGVELGGA